MAKKDFQVLDAIQMLQSGLKNQAAKPNIYGYKPHEKQLVFHQMDKKGRLYIGGNRSGKSYGSVAEDIWWLTGTHPYLATPEPPVRGRLVCVDFSQGLQQIIFPIIKGLLPASALINGSWEDSYSTLYKTLTLSNDSTLEFMSYEQDLEKFAGTSRHFVHYDEEPPLHIFNECNARLVDTNGRYWISMTPVEGLTWTHEKLYEPGKADSRLIGVVEVDMLDNPHITPEAAEDYLSGLDPDERKAREHGTYIQLGGLVYKRFHVDTHVVEPYIPPKDWAWYLSLDHGYNNPTAVLWHAVSPEDHVVTFDEWYYNEKTLDEVAAGIKDKIAAHIAAGGKTPDYFVADPAIAQRSAHEGTSIQTEYSKRGLYFALGNNDVATGVAKIQNYLREDKNTKTPFYTITENCVNYINEMKKLRWKTWASKKMQYTNNPQEQIHKKDDHACDSARYFFSFIPNLEPDRIMTDKVVGVKDIPEGVRAGAPVYQSIDQILAKMVKNQNTTQWDYDESVDLTGWDPN